MEYVNCCGCALRRPAAAFATYPTAKVLSITFYHNLGEISPTPQPTLPLCPANPFSTFPWTYGSTMESLVTLTTTGIKCIKNIYGKFKNFQCFFKNWGGTSPHPPLATPTPCRPSPGPREVPWKV